MPDSNETARCHLDARGLICPEPVVRARRALSQMNPGERLLVDADDPLAELDFRVFCERSGHELVDVEHLTDAVLRFSIRRSAKA